MTAPTQQRACRVSRVDLERLAELWEASMVEAGCHDALDQAWDAAETLRDTMHEWLPALLEQAARVDSAQQYAVVAIHELSDAKAEIAMLRDIVVSYGDRERMANSHRADWQQAIDRAFERDN